MRDSQVDQTRAISHIRSFAFTASKLPADNALGHSEHPNVLVELVSLFGQSLETLHLPAAGLCDSHLEQIVVRCPALTELDTSGNSITNITPLLCAYNASTCLIQSLNVSPAQSINDIVGISDLLELVANKTRRIPLRRLTVPIPTDEHLSNAQNFFEHATTIARTPGSLEYLDFSGRRGSNPIAVIVEVIRQRAVEEASQDKTYKDFTYRSKLAVISVTYQGEDRPTSRLDSELLGLIFSFTQSGRLPVLHLSAWSQE